jgi:superfamily I DNA/RNA helicase
MNLSIRDLKLPDLEPFSNTVDGDISDEKNIFLQNFSTESEERDFILNSVKELLGLGVSEIFVLSRTNRQLNDMSELFNHCNLPHSVRSNDRVPLGAMPDKGVVLATVHSIKGLEADHVFVIGCNSLNFPVKGSEHPVVEMVKVDEYDKESEEQRLFYVAISRAKNYLYLSYTGSLSHFFTVDMLKSIHS